MHGCVQFSYMLYAVRSDNCLHRKIQTHAIVDILISPLTTAIYANKSSTTILTSPTHRDTTVKIPVINYRASINASHSYSQVHLVVV